MPSRRHQKPSVPTTPAASNRAAAGASGPTRDPAEMFAAALREAERQDVAQRERERQKLEAAAQLKADAAAQANALVAARLALDKAIGAVRAAKRNGTSAVEADAEWKAAKARLIELETGERPNWAPKEPELPAEDDEPGEGASDD